MKSFETIEKLVEWFELENYYYRGQQFDNHNTAQKEAENRFDDETVSLDMVKMSKCYIEDLDDVVVLSQYEAHAGDSGVPAEDYFYAYVINH